MNPIFDVNLPAGLNYETLFSLYHEFMPTTAVDVVKFQKKGENGFVGATCYLNSLLQVLFFIPELRYHVLRLDPNLLGAQYLDKDGKIKMSEDKEEQEKINQSVRTIPLYLQQLYSELLLSKREAISTKLFTSEGLGWKKHENFEQQDIAELNRLLLDWIEKSLVNIESMKNIIPYLYEGTVSQVIECSECKNKSERDEVIRDLIVPLSGFDLIDCINEYLKVEELKGDNKYNCEKCNKKVDAIKGMKIKKFAPFLQFSLNRFVYDMRTYSRKKLNNRCVFPLVIDTSLFLTDKIEDIKSIKSKMIWMSDIYQSDERLDEVINRSISYGSNSNNIYDLVAVVCHNGSAFGGHYTVYIRDVFSEENNNNNSSSNTNNTTNNNTLKTEGINEDNNNNNNNIGNNEDDNNNNNNHEDFDSTLFTNTWLDKLMDYYYNTLVDKLEAKGLKNGGMFEFLLKYFFEDFKKDGVGYDDKRFEEAEKVYEGSFLKQCFPPILPYISENEHLFVLYKSMTSKGSFLMRQIDNSNLEYILTKERTKVADFLNGYYILKNPYGDLLYYVKYQSVLLSLENKPYISAIELILMMFHITNKSEINFTENKKYIIDRWNNEIYNQCFGDLEEYIKKSEMFDLSSDSTLTLKKGIDAMEMIDIMRYERSGIGEFIHNYNKTNEEDPIFSFENAKSFYKKYKKLMLPLLNIDQTSYMSGIELLIMESKTLISREGELHSDLTEEVLKKWNNGFYDVCLDEFNEYCYKCEFLDLFHYFSSDRIFPFKLSRFKDRIIKERNMMVNGMNEIDNDNQTFSQDNYNSLMKYYLRSVEDINDQLPEGPFELILKKLKEPMSLFKLVNSVSDEWISDYDPHFGDVEKYIRNCRFLTISTDKKNGIVKLSSFTKNEFLDFITEERQKALSFKIKIRPNNNNSGKKNNLGNLLQRQSGTYNAGQRSTKEKEEKIEKYFGKWYYFNDDKVSKLDYLYQLEDMFGDNINPANGYMLFYRSRIMNKENTNGILVPKIIYNKVPEFWSSKIESENREFEKKCEEEQKEKKEKEYQSKCKKIYIYSEKSIEITDDVVLKYKVVEEEKESQYIENMLTFADLQNKLKEMFKINKDEKIHIYQLVSIQNRCKVPEYKDIKYYHIEREIKSTSGPYIPESNRTIKELGFNNGEKYLVLTDSYVNSHQLSIGSANIPIIVTFHLLYFDQKIDTKVFPYGINKMNMVSRLFYISASLLETEKDEIRISYKKYTKKTNKTFGEMIKDDFSAESTTIEDYFKDIDNIELYIEKKTDSYNGRMLVFRELEKEHSSTNLNIYIQNKDDPPQSLLSKSFLSTLHLREFADILKQYIPDDCKEWCLEYSLPFQEGLPARTLKLRNNEAKYVKDVKDLTLHLYEKPLQEDDIELFCSLWNEKGVTIETLKIVIDRRLTVYELKKKLFELFDIAKEPKKSDGKQEKDGKEKEEETPEEIEYKQLLDNRRIVKIPQSGPIKPLNEENRTIIQVGLNHGDYISLENHKPLIKGNVIIKIHLFDSAKTDFSDIYPSESEYKKEEAYELSMKMRESTVIPLGDGIMIEEAKKIIDLKKVLMSNEIVIQKSKEMKIDDFTTNNIRIHEYCNDKKSPYFYSTGKLFHDAFPIKQLDSKDKEYICVLSTEQYIVSPSDIYYNLLIVPHNERKPKWPYDELIIRKPKNYNITYFEVVNAISNKTKIDKDYLLCAMLLKDWTWKILSPPMGKKRDRFEYPEYCVIWVFSIEKIKIEIKPEYLRRDDIENYLDIKQKEILANKTNKKKAKPRENELKLGVQLQFSPTTPDSETVAKQEETEWSCSQCTFINAGNLEYCEICGFPRK